MRILRPDQMACIEKVRQKIREKHRSILIVAPTGYGKTVVLAAIVAGAVAKGSRAVWLTHRLELLYQSAEAIADRGVIHSTIGPRGPSNPDASCIVASLDTLTERDELPPAELVIFDEAHHSVAPTYLRILEHYKARGALVVGGTATPERGDGAGLNGAFTALVVASTVRELTDAGLLVPLDYRRPKTRLRRWQVAQSPVAAYQEHTPGSRAIVFCPTVEIATETSVAFVDAGVRSRVVFGNMPDFARRDAIESFRRGDLDVLTNVNVLTEGFDVPETSTVILARGFSTTGAFDQAVGRPVRTAPGKTGAMLLDLPGVSHVHGLPYHGREYSLVGVGVSKGDGAGERYCPVCGQILMADGPCPDCGPLAPPPELKVTGVELARYDYVTPMRRLPTEDRERSLVKWIRVAFAKGHKINGVRGKYRAIFGAPPPGAMWARALLEAGRK